MCWLDPDTGETYGGDRRPHATRHVEIPDPPRDGMKWDNKAKAWVEGPPAPDPVDAFLSNTVTKALIDALNDGTLPVGQGLDPEEVKTRIRGKLNEKT